MKALRLAVCLLCVALWTPFPGCGRQPAAKAELEKAAAIMAEGSESPGPPTVQPAADAPAVESPTPAPPAPSASQQVQQALASYKAGQLEDSVTRLHRLRATPTLTAEQRMALQDAIAAVMSEIYDLAEKGDARAIAAVRQYEEMQTSPR